MDENLYLVVTRGSKVGVYGPVGTLVHSEDGVFFVEMLLDADVSNPNLSSDHSLVTISLVTISLVTIL